MNTFDGWFDMIFNQNFIPQLWFMGTGRSIEGQSKFFSKLIKKKFSSNTVY